MAITWNIRSKPVDADGVSRVALESNLAFYAEAVGIDPADQPVIWAHQNDAALKVDEPTVGDAGEATKSVRSVTALEPGSAMLFLVSTDGTRILSKLEVVVKDTAATDLQAEVLTTRDRT